MEVIVTSAHMVIMATQLMEAIAHHAFVIIMLICVIVTRVNVIVLQKEWLVINVIDVMNKIITTEIQLKKADHVIIIFQQIISILLTCLNSTIDYL